MDEPRLALKPGPVLRARRLAAEDETAANGWVVEEVTDQAHEWLDEPVALDAAITLSDLLGLFSSSPLLQQIYRRFYAADFASEAAKGPSALEDADPDDAIERLELRQYWSLDSATQVLEPLHRLTLQGIGVPQRRERPDMGLAAGERIQWSVKGASLGSLLALPLCVAPQVVVSEAGSKDYGRDLMEFLHPHVPLGQVLHSVLWELSFFGAPSERQAGVDDLAERLNAAASEDAGVTMTGEEFDQWLKDFGNQL